MLQLIHDLNFVLLAHCYAKADLWILCNVLLVVAIMVLLTSMAHNLITFPPRPRTIIHHTSQFASQIQLSKCSSNDQKWYQSARNPILVPLTFPSDTFVDGYIAVTGIPVFFTLRWLEKTMKLFMCRLFVLPDSQPVVLERCNQVNFDVE